MLYAASASQVLDGQVIRPFLGSGIGNLRKFSAWAEQSSALYEKAK